MNESPIYYIFDTDGNCHGGGYAYQVSGLLMALERRYPAREFFVRSSQIL